MTSPRHLQDDHDLSSVLSRLIADWEHETVEFKEGGTGFSTPEIGKYFSALANEANLRGNESAWLVFGVCDKDRKVVGTGYRPESERLNALKNDIANGLEPRITFREIYEHDHELGRVLLFEIPAAPRGIPISWNGHYYARAGESLTALDVDKLDRIRSQAQDSDWTGVVVPEARLEDLDTEAIHAARTAFAARFAERVTEVEVQSWTDTEFLERSRLARNGGITRAALLLVGRPQSVPLLSPHMAEITWSLIGEEQAYQHYEPPWLLATTAINQRIRNVQVRFLKPNSLLAIEVAKYERATILEALHNAIAHQDYRRMSRIIVTERVDRLEFKSQGTFFEGAPDEYALGKRLTPSEYRNPFLVKAMSNLNMIDTMGFGIRSMTTRQVKRFLPLPDYSKNTDTEVVLTVYGAVIDEAYTERLIDRTDLPLPDVLALDRVQKGMRIPAEASRRLHRAGLVEGRSPNLRVAPVVAEAADTKAEYIRTREIDDAHYERLILEYLGKFGEGTRREIEDLLANKLSEALSQQQKAYKVTNLLQKMRRRGTVVTAGAGRKAVWRLV